ncbi:TIGR02680 family protein [Actinacidiphila glaucinigra]|uniref:TIGR02680 family protein n=1 Tax=Actinacidiphila glaucinigra TaxID=235986 RepID=UPI0036709837
MTAALPAPRHPSPATAGAAPDLPRPGRSRWQPLRTGLVDLFLYDTEEFHFKDGRLLLRGNNGTGKSKVLALTLPFLLDGDLSARRVEPDADPGKRMEWNLLLGGEHPHPERLGYTWIEFGRRDETTGEEHFRTLACGLKAVSGRGIVRHWFVVTDQRAGQGLAFLDATGTPLSRDRIAEAVTGHGMVYDQAGAYRRAVDEALFGLGEQRYAALVDLLIQLRQPQLSKRPNEAALSKALTEALPPMDQAVIADVAEAFRSLDEEKEELRSAAEAEKAASAFLDHYRRYARIASRRRARLPRTEHARYESLQRELSEARTDRTRADEERAEAEERLAAMEETEARLKAQDAALREGPETRSARELEQAARHARNTADARDRAEGDRLQAEQVLARARARLTAASNRLDAAGHQAGQALATVRDAATDARVELPEDREPDRDAVAAAADRRRRTLDHVQELADAADRATADRLAASRRLDEAEADLAHTQEDHALAHGAVQTASRDLLGAVRERAAGWTELAYPDPVGLLDELQDWTEHLNGPYPAREAAVLAHRGRSGELAARSAEVTQRRAELDGRRRTAEAELGVLESGGRRGPRPPYTRTPGVRDGAPGAPLWRLVDFRETVPEQDRAGIEAALEASGLLDAWVRPDGTALGADGHDILLDPPRGPVPTGALADVLRPAVDGGDAAAAAVGEETVARLLAAIGYGPHDTAPYTDTWVHADGRFRTGALTGRWAKPAAEYIGEGAREEARRARIAVLRAELAGLATEEAAATAEAQTVAARRRTLDSELAAVPDDAPLRQAHARLESAAQQTGRATRRRNERAADLTEATGRAEQATAELARTTADLGLPADRPGLAAVRQALSALDVALAALWPALRERTETARTVEQERGDAAQAAERAAELALRAEEAGHDAAAADERHTTLRSTVGAAVAELERRLAETAAALAANAAGRKNTQHAHTEAVERGGKAGGRIEQLDRDIAESVAARATAIAALQRFTGTGLLTVALPGTDLPPPDAGPWSATAAVALARAVEADLAATDDSEAAWERVQKRLGEELKTLQDALSRHGHSAAARMVEDGMVVDIVYQGRARAVPELADALAVEVGELTRILSSHEREILETHLITEVAGTLQELIGAAERQVAAMNDELEQRPTSTGMKLRLVWRPSRKAPAGLAQARARLRQSADAWTPEDRAAVGEFLEAQITARQSEDASGSWLEHLTAALDYRTWHEFGIERHQQGRWVPATGPASGGERVLAVCVPLFAAASSHYATAGNPHAPRLVTLDEAFAGVDDDSRAKCLGLLHAFDLDVVMTSEREWACYPQVPGIAIAQLSRIDEVAAVLVTRWEWDGMTRTRAVDPARPGTEHAPAEQEFEEPKAL